MNQVPIPHRMAALPRDRRGYPIPVGVFRDSEGRPHFTINDEAARQRHLRHDRCPLCGGKLTRGRWFVGGPKSAFHEHGAYIDPPMHHECAHYALQVCPYLAAPSYTKRIEARTIKPGEPTPTFIDPTMDPSRPDHFVAVLAVKQTFIHDGTGLLVRFIKPLRPYIRVEYWRHGQQIGEDD